MRSVTKKQLIIGFVLLFVGVLIFSVTMSILGWKFTKLDKEETQMQGTEIRSPFQNIVIKSGEADIELIAADAYTVKVECNEKKNYTEYITVEGDTLIIESKDTRAWYEKLFSFTTPVIRVYLPRGEYGTLTVENDTGDFKSSGAFVFESIAIKQNTGDVSLASSAHGAITIHLSTADAKLHDISAGAVSVTTSTGDICLATVECPGAIDLYLTTGECELSSLRCDTLSAKTGTGDIDVSKVRATTITIAVDTGEVELSDAIATGTLTVTSDTGDVSLDASDAGEIFITTKTGDIQGTLLTEKIFLIVPGTGRVDVPKTVSGGRCELETETGNIIISIKTT